MNALEGRTAEDLRQKLRELGLELPYDMDAVPGVFGILYVLLDEILRLKAEKS